MNAFLQRFSLHRINANLIGTLPIFFAANFAALVIWALNLSQHTMPLMLGIIAAGLSDLDNRLSGRLTNLFFTLAAFAASSLSAELALSHGWLFVPLITAITFIVIMLGAIGQRYSTIAFGTLLVAVYTTLSHTPHTLWYSNTLLILLGTLIYGKVALLVYLLFPNRTVQENMAQFYEALSHYLQIKSDFFDPDDTDNLPAKKLALAQANINVMAALDKTRVSLFYRLRGQHRHLRTQTMLRYFFSGQDIWERASSSHTDYLSLFQSLQTSDLIFRLQRILELQATACRQIAHSLRHNERYQHHRRGENVLGGIARSLQIHQAQGLNELYKLHSITENLRNIEGQLARLATDDAPSQNVPKNHRLIAENVSGLRNMYYAIRSQCHFDSALFRHAVRLSIVVFCASLLVECFRPEQGYWILLTAILVCQPNYSATKKRLIQRMVGTLAGVIVGMSLRYFSPTLEAQLGLIVASSSLFFLFRTNNYSFSTFFVTIQVLVSFDIIGLGANSAMWPRIIDTLIGVSIAWLAVSYLWADWKYLNLDKRLKESLRHSAHYLRHIIGQLQFGYKDDLAYRTARRAAQNALATLSTAVSDMTGEPKKYRRPLEFAPDLLGLSYTLMSYISALGANRLRSEHLGLPASFAAQLFKAGKHIADLLLAMARAEANLPEQIEALQQTLNQIEHSYPEHLNEHTQQLLQQLRLIAQLLPALQTLVETVESLGGVDN